MAIFSRRAEIQWDGDVMHGSGQVAAASGAFAVPVTFPSTLGEGPGKTTPEELLAASHATCYGIGLRGVIGRRGGSARRVIVSATVTAEKGPGGIRIQSSHLEGVVEGLETLDEADLPGIAEEVAAGCTISIAIRGAVHVTYEVRAFDA
jgi:osmotically inducible protein OsmC